ncbi:MAG: flagellar biosynthetic protein FliR [Rickettsiales bacterium]|nr:flagellar biosynthetic protein FliR [Rickettsiales bacterium]
MTIESFIVAELFAFLLIFVRIGSGIMLLPGVGETYVSPRIRLPFALLIALVLTPVLQEGLPRIPDSPLALTAMIAGEMVIGIFFGFLARYLIAIMHTVGVIISYQSSLAAATMFDVSQATQGSVIGNFLSMIAVVLIFTTNLHHLMLQGLVDSYTLFVPGEMLPLGDIADTITRLVSDVFNIAVKLASPLIAMGLIFYLAAGILARLMPNMQVFFVIIPLQIQISFWVLMTTLSGMLLWYLDFAEARLTAFLGG